MAEGEGPKFDIDAQLAKMQKEYPGHASMREPEKTKNNMRTSMSYVMTPAGLWKRKGASEELIEHLYRRGFARVAEIYSDDFSRPLIKEVIEEDIENEIERANQIEKDTGKRPPLTKEAFYSKYKKELGLEE